MIRHWCAAFDDLDPVYLDDEFALGTRFGGLVAPPLMLQTWSFPTPMLVGIADRGGHPVPSTGRSPLSILDDAGYVGTLASNSEFEIVRYLRVGDTVTAETTLDEVSEEKQTRLGVGFFVTWLTTYTDQHGDVVGWQRFRVFKFKPPTPAPKAESGDAS
jgi:acyl dehydratase